MTATAQQLKLAFGLTPERAIEYFRAKDIRITRRAHDMAASAHARAFTVAGVTKAEVLQDIRDSLDAALEEGQTYEEFLKTLRPTLQKRGWWGTVHDPETGEILPGRAMTPYRLETVYRTNMQSAYMAGRYKAQLENADARPYWTYVAVLDGRTRGSHAAMHNRTFRYDDPIWQVWYPPCGYRCRCRVVARSAHEVEADGIALSSGEGKMSDRTLDLGKLGKIGLTGYEAPGGKWLAPDPGFDSNPGWGAYGTDMALARRVQALKNPGLRQQVWAALNGSLKRKADYVNWVNNVLDSRKAGNGVQVVGFVDEPLAQFMQAMQPARTPARVLAISEKRLMHADSLKHVEAGTALNRQQYMMLPEIVTHYDPADVYYDGVHKGFTLVRRLANGDAIFTAVTTDYNFRRAGKLDALVNAYKVSAEEAKNQLGGRTRMADWMRGKK